VAPIFQTETTNCDQEVNSRYNTESEHNSSHKIISSEAIEGSIEHLKETDTIEPNNVPGLRPVPTLDKFLPEGEFYFDNFDKEINKSKNMDDYDFDTESSNTSVMDNSNKIGPVSQITDEDWRKGLLNISPVC